MRGRPGIGGNWRRASPASASAADTTRLVSLATPFLGKRLRLSRLRVPDIYHNSNFPAGAGLGSILNTLQFLSTEANTYLSISYNYF